MKLCLPADGRDRLFKAEPTDDLLDTLVKASPLIFTGLAVAVAFRAKFWNIGAEGQLMAGAVAAGFIGERTFLPAITLVPLMISGAAAGAMATAELSLTSPRKRSGL